MHERVDRSLRVLPIRKEPSMKRFVPCCRPHAHRCLGDDADAPFGAENELANVQTRGGGRKRGNVERAGRRFDARSGEELFDASVFERLLSGRARRDPSAERRVFERLRKVSERVAAIAQLRFQVRTGDAGFEAREPARCIEIEEPLHALEGDREHRCFARRRIHVSGDARAAAIWNDARSAAFGQFEQIAYVACRLRKRDAVGNAIDAAEPQGKPIGQTLPTGVQQARLRIRINARIAGQSARRHVCPNRAERSVTGRRAAAGAFLQIRNRGFW